MQAMPNDTEPAPSIRAIENLIAAYAELVDRGDFAGVGTLLSAATFTGSGSSVRGAAAIEAMLRNTVILYDNGTPKTKHLVTNISVEVAEDARTGTAVSYLTVSGHCHAYRFRRSSAAATTTDSSATTASGLSLSDGSASTLSATSATTSATGRAVH